MNVCLPQARVAKLLVEAVGDELVIYDQRSLQIRRLNRTAAAIWRKCDGRRSVAELVDLTRSELNAPKLTTRAVEQALAQFARTDLLSAPASRSKQSAPALRRQPRGRRLSFELAPTVTSILAPTPLMTSSGAACGTPCTGDGDCASATDGCVYCSNSVALKNVAIGLHEVVNIGFTCVNPS